MFQGLPSQLLVPSFRPDIQPSGRAHRAPPPFGRRKVRRRKVNRREWDCPGGEKDTTVPNHHENRHLFPDEHLLLCEEELGA